ncbi:MAG: hypothetical protein KIS76_07940 [Pyrinomonadaceae bacterium]|nr:hypothetical protein [Pyrinomonadaceae bacterium]
MAETQTFKNHVRWHVPHHFIVTPILLFNFIFAIVRVVQDFNIDRIAYLILAIGLLIMGILVRLNSLTVQNRLIRLEERLRYEKILPEDLNLKAQNLKTNQMIALRFASDEELPLLIERTLNGEFEKTSQIKREIKNWRADHLRV